MTDSLLAMDRTPKPPPVPREIGRAEASQETQDKKLDYEDLLVVRMARARVSGDPADLFTKEEKERRIKGKCTC